MKGTTGLNSGELWDINSFPEGTDRKPLEGEYNPKDVIKYIQENGDKIKKDVENTLGNL